MKNKCYFGDKIHRTKLYKRGKLWVATSMTFLSLGMMSIGTVKADSVSSNSSTNVAEMGGEQLHLK